jgi:O-antigen/teichoic acid export membrane protein
MSADDRSEQRLGRGLLINSLFLLVGIGAHRGLLFVLLPFLTRVLSVDEFGTLGVAIAVVSVLALAMGLNPGPFIIARYYTISRDEMASVWAQILILMLATTVLVAGGLLALPRESLGGVGTLAVLLLVMVGVGRAVLTALLTFLQMEHRAGWYAISSTAVASVTGLFVWVSHGIGALHWWSLFLGEACALVLVTVPLLVFRLRELGTTLRLDLTRLREFVQFSLPVVPHALGLWVMSAADRFFLASLADLRTTGLYSAAYTLCLALALIHEACQRALQPHFFRLLADGAPESRLAIARWTWIYYAGVILLGLAFCGAATVALPFVLGQDFQAAAPLIPTLVLAFTVQGMQRALSGHLYHEGRTRTLATITVVAALINIGLNAVWIPPFGAIGAARATLVSMTVAFVLVKLTVVRNSDLPWWHVVRGLAGGR